MCNWKERLKGKPGLLLGCLASAIVLILSLSSLVNYLKISPSSLPIPIPMAYHHEAYDQIAISQSQGTFTKNVVAYQPNTAELTANTQSMVGCPLQSKTMPETDVSSLLIIILLVIIWFFGIFFSTFSRALAESVRDETTHGK
jgi:hypothetical protein